jgi:hypothetical protein
MEFVLLWLVCAVIAAAIGGRKGEAGSGFLIGLVFGPLGILFALLSSGNRVPCPHCKEMIHKKAKICPQCRTALAAKA